MLLQSAFPSLEETVEAVFPKHRGSWRTSTAIFLNGQFPADAKWEES